MSDKNKRDIDKEESKKSSLDKSIPTNILNEEEAKERKIVKKIALFLAGLIFIGTVFYSGLTYGRSLPVNHRYYPNNKVYASVGNDKIKGKQLKTLMEPYFYVNGLDKLSNEEISTYEATMIQYLTNIEVLYQEATKNDITVKDSEIEKNYKTTMESVAKEFNMSEEEFLNKFKITKGEVEEHVKKELIGNKYLENYSNVDDEEAKNYYDNNKDKYLQVKASHILISNYTSDNKEVDKEQKKENLETAEQVLEFALSGEDFAKLAKEYSDDASASDGGNLGYFSKDDMVDEFADVAFSLKDGEIYKGVVTTSAGYHIIKKTGQRYQPFDDVKNSIVAELENSKKAMLLKDLYNKYDISMRI